MKFCDAFGVYGYCCNVSAKLLVVLYQYTPCPQKEATKLLAITFSNLNRFLTFFHWQTQEETFYEHYVDVPPHITYVATLPCET